MFEVTIKTRCEDQSSLEFPQVFDFLDNAGSTSAKKRIEKFTNIPFWERPVIVLCVTGTPRHVIVLWGVE